VENRPITLATPGGYPIQPRHKRWAWIIGIGAFVFYGTLYTALPPVDGDAYEYAEVAHNLLETGNAVHSHLRYPALTETELPMPAGRRLNFYTLLCGFFELMFGPGVLVILLPFLFGVLLLPRACLSALAPLFGSRAALLTSIMLLLHPRFMAVFIGDPNVEMLLTVSFLFAAAAFYREHYLWFGLLVGLGFLIKVNAVVLAIAGLLSLAFCARHKLRGKDVLAGFLLAFCLALPFVLRLLWNLMEGHPTTEGSLIPYLTLDWLRERSLVELAFRTATTLSQEPQTHGIVDMLSFSWVNITKIITGYEWSFMREAGLLEMSGYGLALFSPIGIWCIAKPQLRVFTALFVLGFLLFHGVLILGHEARFLMPVLPWILAAGLAGVTTVLGEPLGLRIGQSLTLLMVVPVLVVSLYICGSEVVSGEGREVYHELKNVSEMIPDDHEKLISIPFFSASYFTGRLTIPPPLEPMKDWIIQARQMGAQGILMRRLGMGGCLPFNPKLRLYAETKHFCYFSLPNDLADLEKASPAWTNHSPLDSALSVQHSDPYRSTMRFALESTSPWISIFMYFGVLGFVGLLTFLIHPRLEGLVVLMVSVTFALYMLVNHDEGAANDSPPSLEELLLKKQGIGESAFSFEPLVLPEATAPLSCNVSNVMATCPAPLGNYRCDGQDGPVVVGCPNWTKPSPGTQEAESVTRILNDALDKAALRLESEDMHVLRFERIVIGLPMPKQL
jgi:4-amino-4-deoxy-L-arabinose transferase-like glycosyltransferase